MSGGENKKNKTKQKEPRIRTHVLKKKKKRLSSSVRDPCKPFSSRNIFLAIRNRPINTTLLHRGFAIPFTCEPVPHNQGRNATSGSEKTTPHSQKIRHLQRGASSAVYSFF